ncbi:MAG TPA: hypothetical protein VFN89_01410 [Solirubrobacterales bacterium]|nr:hypothetical protein [Solirubrobacterales bacterium]
MVSRLREQFSTTALILSIIALVAALSGGAYAAQASRHSKKSHVIITKLNQIKPSVQKQLKGNVGPAGPQGPKGDNGSNGSNGAKGDAGPTGPPGPEGPEGEEGEEGSPWTAGGTLPVGSTETGSYTFTIDSIGNGRAAISFPIPLTGELDSAHTIINPSSGAANANCENAAHAGAASASNPEAKSGFLCVFPASTFGGAVPVNVAKSSSGSFGTAGASNAGAVLTVFTEGEPGEPAIGSFNWGTFAVTG